MKNGHVTLADVAERASVSVSTASRALAGLNVNKKNHAKVINAANELGYVMNEAARSLRNVKTMTVGLIFHELTGLFGIELLSSISSRLDSDGYCVFVATAQGDSERFDKLAHRFLERRVDALFCVHGAGSGADLERYKAAGIPVIGLISKNEGYKSLPLFAPDTSEAAQDCVKSLQKLGHEQILVLTHSRPFHAIDDFIRVSRKEGMKVKIEALSDGAFDATRILEFCQTGKSAPTVIIATQSLAVQLLTMAEKMKIAIPERVSIVAVRDRTSTIQSTKIPMSKIYLNPQKVGITAADKLLDHFKGETLIEGDTLVEMASWLESGTTGPAFVKNK